MKRLSRLLQLIVSAAILIYLFHLIPFAEVAAVLVEAEAGYLVIACCLAPLLEVIGALRLKLLTDIQGFSIGTPRLLEINLVARFYKLFIPGGVLASLAVRYYKLQKAERRRAAALSAIVVDRLAATLGLCVVGLVAWLIDRPQAMSFLGWIMVAAMAGGLALMAMLLGRRAGSWALAILERLPVEAAARLLRSWMASLAQFRGASPRALLLIVLYTVLVHLVGVCLFAALAASLGMAIDLLTWAWIRSTVTLLTMVPVSLSGLGIREGALLALLGAYGVVGEDALALGLLLFAVNVLIVASIGGLLEGRAQLLPRRA